jgi:uncharacterized protein YjbI with pentapeptide repeats
MEFRDISDDARMQRPTIDRDELTKEVAAFKGEFNHDAVHIDRGSQSGVTGEGTLSHSLVTGVDLTEAQLTPLTMSDVVLNGVDMSEAVFRETTARRVEIINCRAIGAVLNIAHASDLYIQGGQFDYATIRIAEVKNVAVFDGCSFEETNFIGDMSRIHFTDCTFHGAQFEATRATDCDLRGSQLNRVYGILSLRGAKITTDQAFSIARGIATESGLTVVD